MPHIYGVTDHTVSWHWLFFHFVFWRLIHVVACARSSLVLIENRLDPGMYGHRVFCMSLQLTNRQILIFDKVSNFIYLFFWVGRVLRIEPQGSVRVLHAVYHWATTPVLCLSFCFCFNEIDICISGYLDDFITKRWHSSLQCYRLFFWSHWCPALPLQLPTIHKDKGGHLTCEWFIMTAK